MALCLFFGESHEEMMRILVDGRRSMSSWSKGCHVPTTSAISQAPLGWDPSGAGTHPPAAGHASGDNVRGRVAVAAALSRLHGQDVPHRGIKPANILSDAAGLLKIMDFGIAPSSAMAGVGSAMSPRSWLAQGSRGRVPSDTSRRTCSSGSRAHVCR
ncbi:serine/threonine protein kinase [Parafrankia sp. EAN1pec]|uniref:protein kinase domain-containing protein n=1 Tax=Parafrankia sp. (strain EAN1pec) TaxID=298653 RepID=UPI0000545059|nr:serine/threonine protein kinase [Frankia sp. EAN1pec]